MPGTELLAEGMGSCPGGIANLAVAASRLGLRTALASVFGDDVYGDFLWRTLAEQEGVDLSRSRAADGLALAGHGLAGGAARPGHGDPQPSVADSGQ